MAKDIRFETPLMWIDKAETWALADELGVLDLIRHETLTCYNGVQGMAAVIARPVSSVVKDWKSIWR